MTTERAKWILASVWLAGGTLLLLIMVVQSMLQYYEPYTQDAWGWFLPAVLPTLLLIVGVLVADFLGSLRTEQQVTVRQISAKYLFLPLGLSVIYLVLVALPIIIPAFVLDSPPLEVMKRSNLWLGPFQGLTVGALGGFFRAST